MASKETSENRVRAAGKSKLPQPRFSKSMDTKSRGLKRGISPVTGNQSSVKGQRRVLGELQTSGLGNGKDPKVSESSVGKVPSRKTVQFAVQRVEVGQRNPAETSFFEDQSGIEFEPDRAALDSILNDTGIQVPAPVPGGMSRHTIAAAARRRTSSMAPPARVPVKEFQRACEDVLSKNTQPASKRPRIEGDTEDNTNFNLKLTPSKTDFCSKFDVQKSGLFKQDTNPFGRPSLYNPSRLVVDENNPFAVPSRPSLAMQSRKRQNQDPCGLSVIKSESNTKPDTSSSSIESTQPWTPFSRRFSLAARNISQDSTSITGRPSVSAMTPQRVPVTRGDTNGANTAGSVSAGEGPVDFKDSMKVSIKDEKGASFADSAGPSVETWTPFSKRISLAGRRENPDSNIVFGRPSLSASSMTPRRVPVRKSDNPFTVGASTNFLLSVGRFSLAKQTPLRVVKEEKGDECVSDESQDKLATKLVFGGCDAELTEENGSVASLTSSNMLRSGNTGFGRKDEKLSMKLFAREIQGYVGPTLDDAIGSPAVRNIIQDSINTPISAKPPRHPKTPNTTTPSRVPRQLNTPQITPPARVRRPHTPLTPASRVPRQPNTPQITPPARVRSPHTPLTPASKVPLESVRRCLDSEDKENVPVKHPDKNVRSIRDADGRQGAANGDIRSYWKTKKTPSKSPITKEVLVREGMIGQTEQIPCPQNVDQDAMQASPAEENVTPPPPADVPLVEPQTVSTFCQQNLPSMQLPVASLSLGLESSGTAFLHENYGPKNKNQSGADSHQQVGSQSQLQTGMTKLSTAGLARPDSSEVTQPKLGQDRLGRSVGRGKDGANSSRHLKRAIIVQEAKEALAAYQARRLGITVPDVSQTGLCDVNWNVMLRSDDLDLKNGNIKSDDQILSAELGDNLNENQNDNKQIHSSTEMVAKNANAANRQRGLLDTDVQNYSSPGSQSWMMCDSSSEKNLTNLAPFTLRKSSSQGTFSDKQKSDFQTFRDKQSLISNEPKCTQYADKNLNSISPPLWTPLVMKSVAKQISVVKTESKDITTIFVKKEPINGKQVLDNVAGLVPSACDNDPSTSDDKTVIQLGTPPSAKRRSAFRRYDDRSGLTPTIGGLSLRANMETRKRRPLDKKRNELHHLAELYLAYTEECVNCEVERLSLLWRGPESLELEERCPDPVARILMEGDEMHFCPIEDQCMSPGAPNSLAIEGSAFIRVADQRST